MLMPVVIASKTEYTGTVTPTTLDTETTVVEITAQNDTYIVEGWMDLRNLASGDTVIIKVYVAVDGTTYSPFIIQTYSGVVGYPVVRFHSMQLCKNMKYKVTITQTSGTLRSFPYGFILEVMGTQ
jgi:hypothetical protein